MTEGILLLDLRIGDGFSSISAWLSNTCFWLQAPDKPDEKLDGFSVSDVPRVEPNVVRMDVTGGFAMQKIGPDRMIFRYPVFS